MGADLYLYSEYRPNHAKWEPEFNHWVEIRDGLMAAGEKEAASDAQKKVDEYFGKMLSKGHFRDAYNDGNLLWKFGLSWWLGTEELVGEDGKLSPEKAGVFLRILAENEAEFKANIKNDPDRKYFKDKYRQLRTLLKKAVARNESIACSV